MHGRAAGLSSRLITGIFIDDVIDAVWDGEFRVDIGPQRPLLDDLFNRFERAELIRQGVDHCLDLGVHRNGLDHTPPHALSNRCSI
jgi:hypothetical protein